MARFDLNIVNAVQAPDTVAKHGYANQSGRIDSVKQNQVESYSSNNPMLPLAHENHGPAVKVSVTAAFVITPDGVVHRLDGDKYVPYIDPIDSYQKMSIDT